MLELVVFVSGALVMVLEMVGARVLAPHLGTSVIVWTSLIGVVLACLAAGAWLGGRLADRAVSERALARILAAAGAGTLLTALLHGIVGEAISERVPDLRAGAVVAAIILFGGPATLFGMVGPYVARLRLADMRTAGATVGRLSALSTAGSIVGTFLGGFVLVSYFGSTHILLGTGGGMVALSLMACRSRPVARLLLLCGVGALLWATASYAAYAEEATGIRVVETPYNHIRVYEGLMPDGLRLRCLATDPGRMQSAMYPDRPDELALPYTRFFALGPLLVPDASKVLMLGGGAFSVPRWLLAGGGGLDASRLSVDVVELDPGMTAEARRSFGLTDDPRLRVFHEDARVFCNRNRERYDLVLVDVFGSHYTVPFHAGTVEAARTLRAATRDDGVLLMNVIAAMDGVDGRLFRAIRGALAAHFAEVHVFAVRDSEDRHGVQNLMLLALPVPRPDFAPYLADVGERIRHAGTPTAAARDEVPHTGGNGMATVSGGVVPDAAMPDAAMPDAAIPDAAMPDGVMLDSTSASSPHPVTHLPVTDVEMVRLLASRVRALSPDDTPPLRDDFAPVERYALGLLRR